jgi:hypothetical protein
MRPHSCNSRYTGSEAQEPSCLHRLAEKRVERLAAGILEQQRGPAVFAHKRQRPHQRPSVQFIPQSVFVSQLINEAWWGLFRGGEHGQHGLAVAVIAIQPSSAEEALTILAQDCEASGPARSE